MLHIFKLNGRTGAYDCTARRYTPLSPLTLRLADAVTPPIPKDCPSALRYAFAKYDSNDLNEAYVELYALFTDPCPADAVAAGIPADEIPYREYRAASAEEAAAILRDHQADVGEAIVLIVDHVSPAQAAALKDGAPKKLMLIAALEDDLLTEDDVALLNGSGVYVQLPPDKIEESAARGLRYLSAALPASQEGAKAAARIARIAERCRDAGQPVQFAPFTLALCPRADHDPQKSGCADCWAREICGGKRLGADGTPTEACTLERTLIECAVILSAPPVDDDE